MNWIAEQFEKLKARVEAHIPATNKALNDLDSRLSGVEHFTSSAVADIESRTKSAFEQEQKTVASVEARVTALEALAKQHLQASGS